MDYEKKYKDALERARNIRFCNPNSATANVVCEEIFPELKESEDERIRKEIIDFLIHTNKYGTNEKCESWLAWLEKQGKQKPVLPGFEEQEGVAGKDYIPIEWVEAIENYGKWKIVKVNEQNPAWSEEDDKMIDDLTQTISQYTVFAHREPKEIIQWLKSLKSQSHWKPTEEQINALLDCVNLSTKENFFKLNSLYEQLIKL